MSGCANGAPPQPGGLPSTTPSSTPSPTPTPAAFVPESRYDLSCDELVSSAEVAVLLGPGAYRPLAATPPLPATHAFALRNLGGMACYWSSEPIPHPWGTESMDVRVMPDAAKWRNFADTIGSVNADSVEFGDESLVWCGFTECTASILVRDSWIDVRITSAGIAEAATGDDKVAVVRATLEDIVTRVRTAQAETWTQVAVPPIPTECEALLPVASVRDTFGLEGVLTHRKLAGGWGLDATSIAHAGVTRCGISVDFSDGYVAELSALNNGAWAFEHTATWLSPTSKEVTVAGTSGPSYLHCPVGEEAERSIDMVIGDVWVHLITRPTTSAEITEMACEQVLELAGVVAKQFAG